MFRQRLYIWTIWIQSYTIDDHMLFDDQYGTLNPCIYFFKMLMCRHMEAPADGQYIKHMCTSVLGIVDVSTRLEYYV